jgi:hypothetical protein
MKLLLLAVGIAFAGLFAPASAQFLGSQPCAFFDAALPSQDGYTSIGDINADQQFELDRIAGGGVPNPPYIFNICPGTILDPSQGPLTPLLEFSIFRCGTTEAAALTCEFFGGTDQVLVEDSVVPGYDIFTIEFNGIRFQNFTNSALTASADESTNVVLTNVVFSVSTSLTGVLRGRRYIVCGFLPSLYACMLNDCRISILSL